MGDLVQLTVAHRGDRKVGPCLAFWPVPGILALISHAMAVGDVDVPRRVWRSRPAWRCWHRPLVRASIGLGSPIPTAIVHLSY